MSSTRKEFCGLLVAITYLRVVIDWEPASAPLFIVFTAPASSSVSALKARKDGSVEDYCTIYREPHSRELDNPPALVTTVAAVREGITS